jgi:hypothetical protein
VAAITAGTWTTGCSQNENCGTCRVARELKRERSTVQISNAVWAAVSIIVVVLAVVRIARTTTIRTPDMGSVSDQWLAQHRVSGGTDVAG